MAARKRSDKAQRKRERTQRRLAVKRSVVLHWLSEQETGVPTDVSDASVLKAAYAVLKKPIKFGVLTAMGAHARYSHVIQWAGLDTEWRLASGRKSRTPRGEPRRQIGVDSIISKTDAEAFYRSYEWRKLRYQIIQRDGGRCLCCGASPSTGATLHVDHIKPLRLHWSLRLDPTNLQTLCEECNHGKGRWDSTDWRKASPQTACEAAHNGAH